RIGTPTSEFRSATCPRGHPASMYGEGARAPLPIRSGFGVCFGHAFWRPPNSSHYQARKSVHKINGEIVADNFCFNCSGIFGGTPRPKVIHSRPSFFRPEHPLLYLLGP